MLCPKCHTNNPDGEKYCKNCGFQLIASRICPECGAQNKHDTKFCRECGASLSPVSSFRRDVIDNQNTSFFNKYKLLIIASIILVLAVGAVAGIALYNNASSNTGRSDDGFSFFPLVNDTNQDSQLDDVNDTNQSVNETNKTVNDTDKNKTSDKNKDNFTDKNKNATKKNISDSNNVTSVNKTNKSAESVENHSKGTDSNVDKTKNTSSDSNSDKSSKVSSQDSKSDKSSKAGSSDSKSDNFNKDKSDDSKSDDVSDSKSSEFFTGDDQNSSNESTDDNAIDEDNNKQGNASDEEDNEIDMADVPELAEEVQSNGYDFSTIEFDGNDLSQSQCIAIFAEYISTSTSGSIEIPQVDQASSPSGEDLNQSVSKPDYEAVAKDVNSYIGDNGRIPDNAVISGEEESDISPSKILELFTKVITQDFPESVDI